jgi:c-di-GMP-binding flagellar brake protein YcgR
MSKDQRRFPRKEIKVSVELTFLDEPYTIVKTRDISEGGMFIEVKSADTFPIGELVNVHYLDPLNDNEDTYKDAAIVRVVEEGIAISFIEMADF